jgi:hypothetical protein
VLVPERQLGASPGLADRREIEQRWNSKQGEPGVWSALGAAIYPTSHLAPPAHQDEAASGLLGPHHALSRALAVRRVLVKQSLLVAVVVFAGVLALIEHASEASSLLFGALAVEATLACAVAISTWHTHDRVIELIIDGREDLPLLAIERERRRLLDRGNRKALVARIDQVRQLAQQSAAPRDAWPLRTITYAAAAEHRRAATTRAWAPCEVGLRVQAQPGAPREGISLPFPDREAARSWLGRGRQPESSLPPPGLICSGA